MKCRCTRVSTLIQLIQVDAKRRGGELEVVAEKTPRGSKWGYVTLPCDRFVTKPGRSHYTVVTAQRKMHQKPVWFPQILS